MADEPEKPPYKDTFLDLFILMAAILSVFFLAMLLYSLFF